jgi:uncharacterized membrane protein YhhN
MDPVAGIAFFVAGVFAIGDWIACAHDRSTAPWNRIEYVCKPAVLTALVVAAAALHPAASADARQPWFVAALVFSLAGDVLLMLPSEQFVAGLSAFLVGHVCYIVGFWTNGPELVPFLIAAVIVALIIGSLARRILPGARREDQALVVPVTAYMAVIGVMVATALAVGNPIAALGAVLFAASDTMIAWDRFLGPFPSSGVWIMTTYHLGQAGLVVSLLR